MRKQGRCATARQGSPGRTYEPQLRLELDEPVNAGPNTLIKPPQTCINLHAHEMHQVREAPISQLTLLANGDTEAERHARLLARRQSVHAVTVLRWVEWEPGDREATVEVLRAPQLEQAADGIVNSLPATLRSLVIGEFALTCTTFDRLGRCAAILVPDCNLG